MDWFRRLPTAVHNHIVFFLGEFVGTFLFLFFALSGTQVANVAAKAQLPPHGNSSEAPPNIASLLYISLVFGFSLGVNIWVFYRISGGLFNPAVALGMCLIGALSWTRGLIIFIAQLLASIVSAEVVSALFPGPMIVQTRLGPGTSKVRGMFIEMFLTAGLVFTIFMLAVEKHKATFLAPVGISLAFFIAELSGLYYTGASLNPARSFGPNVVLANFPGSSWIYWVGPLLGSLLAVGFFKIVKFLEYENVNPDQDGGGDFDHMADVIEAQQRKHTEASSTPTIETCVQPQRPVAYFRSDSNNTTVVGGSVSRPDGMYSLEEQPEEGSRDSRMDDRMEDHIERTESAYSQGPAMESGELDHIEHASDS